MTCEVLLRLWSTINQSSLRDRNGRLQAVSFFSSQGRDNDSDRFKVLG